MMQLGDLSLPDLIFSSPWATNAVSAPRRRRLDGGLAVYPRALAGGRVISLTAPADQPLTVTQADALAEMAANIDATYALSMPLRSFSAAVIFDWGSGDALALELLFDFADPAAEDPVVGSIHLITV